MKLYDDIKLNVEIEELSVRGIHQGCLGTIVNLGKEKSLVLFFNRADVGDYAFAWTENAHLDYLGRMDDGLIKKFAEHIATMNPAEKLSFEESHLREYDTVKLIVEKQVYAKHGAHKGMIGTILDPEKISGSWLVFFSDETGADTIGIAIKEKDLELIHHSDGTTD